MTPEVSYNICITKNQRIKEYESIISTDPGYSYLYAKNIIKGRWPEAESVILKNVNYSYYYALCIVKGRWHKAEPIILKYPGYCYFYAKDIIKGRWIKAEDVLITSSFWYEYCDYFKIKQIKVNWKLGL